MRTKQITAALGILLISNSLYASDTYPTKPIVNGEIATLAELRWLSENPSAWAQDWELTADIDATDSKYWNVGDHDGDIITSKQAMGFSPIGDTTGFRGNFDGNNHTITNLYINRPTESVGLFHTIESGSKIKSLKLNTPHYRGAEIGGVVVAINTEDNDFRVSGIEVIDPNFVANSIGVVAHHVAPRAAEFRDIKISGDIHRNVVTRNIGGIVASSYSPINIIDVELNLAMNAHYVGGLVQSLHAPLYTEKISGSIKIDSQRSSGGFVRNANGDIKINRLDDLTISVKNHAVGSVVGGLVPSTKHRLLINNSNINIDLTQGAPAYAGGIAGSSYSITKINNSNFQIKANSLGNGYGGLIGLASMPIEISDSKFVIDNAKFGDNKPSGALFGGIGADVTIDDSDFLIKYEENGLLSGILWGFKDNEKISVTVENSDIVFK